MFEKVTIKSKKSIGKQEVYDISVSEQHHYILENDVISHNSGTIFASSIVVAMQKKKLRDKEIEGGSTSDIKGIKASCKVMKSRYAKPFEKVDVFIPYDTGMDPNSGLLDLFKKSGIIKNAGAWYTYTSNVTGEEVKVQKKNMDDNYFKMIIDECSTSIDKIDKE